MTDIYPDPMAEVSEILLPIGMVSIVKNHG